VFKVLALVVAFAVGSAVAMVGSLIWILRQGEAVG
jgi:hypothetical protein